MRKRLLPYGAIYSCYLLVAVIITWPLALNIGTRLIGHPFGDSYEYVHHIWWLKRALQTGQPLFFQPLLGYPDGLSSVWLWTVWLQSFPVVLLSFALPLPVAFNLVALLRLALNGWSLFFLMNHLLNGRHGPALLAGLVFMLFPAFQGQLAAGHVGLLALWPVPLYLYALFRLREDGFSRRWWLAGALLFTLSLGGSPLLLVFITGPVTMLILFMRASRRDWRGAGHIALTAGAGLALAFLFLVPRLIEQQTESNLAIEAGDVHFSADLLSVVTPSFYHPLFAQFEYTHRVLGIDPFERMGYIGMVAGALALIGVWRARTARWWLLLAAVAWILSLGPLLKIMDRVVTLHIGDYASFVTLPWLAFQNLPLLNITRTPARFQFALALALAVMAGYGAVSVWERTSKRWRWGIVGALMLLIAFEYQSWWPMPSVSAIVPQPVAAIGDRDGVRAVINLPWDHLLAQKDGMFLQTGHGVPLVVGHVTRRTPVNPAKLAVLQSTLDPALLKREGADVVIWHKQWAEDKAEHPRQRLGQPIYEDDRIAVFDVPDIRDEPRFTAVIPDVSDITDRANLSIFAPEPGWATLEGGLQTNGQRLTLLLDGIYLRDWDGETPVPLPAAGYHTLNLALEPPCPEHTIAPLACRAAKIEQLALTDFTPGRFAQPSHFERGVELAGAMLSQMGDSLSVRLWWRFAQPMSDHEIRFVHVLDVQGNLVAQADAPLAGRGAWVEQLDFADLPDGEYDIYTGWYTLPDVTRLAVLSDVPDAASNRVHLGRVEIGDSDDS